MAHFADYRSVMPNDPAPPHARPHVMSDARVAALAAALRTRTQAEVMFDAGARAVYSADASNYRQIPIGVVVPRSVDDVLATLAVCREFDVPVLARGGGTSQCGQCVNVAVVIDNSKYLNRVLAIDPDARTATVEPGIVCDALRDAAELHGLTFGPDPATHSRCTLGGMIGNNSCGAHSVMAGKTVENVETLDVVTYDGVQLRVGPTSPEELEAIITAGGRRGEIYRGLRDLRDRYAELIRAQFPKIKRRVSGYNLDQLLPENGFNVARALVGSEGTCAYTLQAVTRLVKSPAHRVLLILGYADIYAAGDAVPHLLPFGPIATEGLDEKLIGGLRSRGLRLDDIARLPPGRAWLMIEFGGDTPQAAHDQAAALAARLATLPGAPSAWLIDDPALCERMWSIRETAASATALTQVPGAVDPTVGWEDAAVDPLRLGSYLRDFQALVDRYGYETSLYGHFGDGCIHARITFDLRSTPGVGKWRDFLREAAQLVVAYGGSLSGEHGDGQARAEFLPLMYSPELMQAFREFKRIWDPGNRMNPGKLIDPYRVDENLRLGPDYRPAQPATHFAFRTPEGNGFTRAVEHCVGMGKCRSHLGGVMCPSYRATGDERHSTRGRSRLLGEMLRGDVIADGWKSEAVREALELCFGCKGCKSECPTHCDMASYKAEFMAHHYEGRWRPVQAYSMGLIQQWARLAAHAPRLVNACTQTPLLAGLAKKLGGIAPERAIPRFATRTFRQQYSPSARGGQRVILWADTFNNHFHPGTATAAARVLEALGCDVALPPSGLCCGRPLYDFGFLDRAKRQLATILDRLAPDIEAGTPIIGLEPACTSVFRDELLNLFPDDARAQRLAQAVVPFSTFVVQHPQWSPTVPLSGAALVHGHCHQKALLGMDSELALLRSTGLETKLIASSCCGMAGSFGFHPQHYAVSMKAGEAALLPAVRKAPTDTLIVASGYSCREQIVQGTGRETLHVADIAARALGLA